MSEEVAGSAHATAGGSREWLPSEIEDQFRSCWLWRHGHEIGAHRDKFATQQNLIASEMDASGVWDLLPCLVIKGVCNYSTAIRIHIGSIMLLLRRRPV